VKREAQRRSAHVDRTIETDRRVLCCGQARWRGHCRCFTENGVVTDEGHTYRGRSAIQQWKADASAKYDYISEPFASDERDGKTIVTSRLTGNFPGSPVNLRFFFKLEGEKIAALEIIP